MQKYYEEAARILTKVFNASRLETEVSPDMVELLISERELEKERSSAVIEKIKQILTDAHFESERENVLVHSSGHEVILSGRIKTVVSAMYNLLATKNGEHQNLNDMLGLMIICEDVKTCYELRDLLSDKLVEIGDTIISEKDMISKPKQNGYQSIHLHVSGRGGVVFEIQIKSYKMFAFSQTGDCKHELYKKRLYTSSLSEEEWLIFDSLREEHWF